ISSTNRTVRLPRRWRRSASSTIFFKSLTPEVTAENRTQRAPPELARISASVVLPLPGGPQRMSERSSPAPTMPRRNFPGPSRCCWPTNSSSALGRMRSASGTALAPFPAPAVSKSSMRNMLAQFAAEGAGGYLAARRAEQVPSPAAGKGQGESLPYLDPLPPDQGEGVWFSTSNKYFVFQLRLRYSIC